MDEDTRNQAIPVPLGSVEPHARLLTVPPDGQFLYKMMTIQNLLRSVLSAYLHFNRVDSYLDCSDGQQLLKDQQGNARAKLEKSPDFSMADYYDQSRGRTYACCFSLENSDFIWKNYPNESDRGKVCIVFDFGKLRETLNRTLRPGNAALEYGGIRCEQIFSINYGIVEYIDRAIYQANALYLPNPIKYTYLKDLRFCEEKELRVSLSALGVGQFVVGGSKMEFPTYLQMAFDFRAAIADGTINEILSAPDSDAGFLRTELHKLRILTK